MSFAFPGWSRPLIEVLGFVPPTIDSDVMLAAESALAGAGREIGEAGPGIDAAVGRVLSNLEGAPAEAFAAFAAQVKGTIGELEAAAGNLAGYAGQVALSIETANYSILLMLIWTAEQLAEWADTLWGAAVVPEILALARLLISRILAQLLRSVLASVAAMAGINAVVQAIEFLKGDRTRWDFGETLGAAEAGAVFGAVSGVTHLARRFHRAGAGGVAGRARGAGRGRQRHRGRGPGQGHRVFVPLALAAAGGAVRAGRAACWRGAAGRICPAMRGYRSWRPRPRS